MNCKHCGSTEIDEDRRRGDVVCMSCGAVLEESIIVNEVEFQERPSGSSAVIGQFVTSGGIMTGPSLASKLGFQRESRQITLENAKKRFQEVGSQLRLNQHHIDMGFSFYQTVLGRGWTRGRRVNYVIAACLYIVCRTEGTHHMLLDLSDVLQVNVYTLGRTYLEIAKRLCISIPALDPCLYIQRFAQKLEFAENTMQVEQTAMRLLQRMKKDWIAVGRRPSGLAAAALLVAGRLHNFNRTFEDVSRIAKISEQTARKRLQEFAKTPSSSLTIEEFLNVDYEEEYDPPSFYEGLKKTKNLEEDDLDRICDEVNELERRIDVELDKLRERRVKGFVSRLATESCAADPSEPSCSTANKSRVNVMNILEDDDNEVNLSEKYILKDALEGVVKSEELDGWVDDLHNVVTDSEHSAAANTCSNEEEEESSTLPAPMGATGSNTAQEMMTAVGLGKSSTFEDKHQSESESDNKDGILDLTDIDDDEIEREYLLTKREVLIKARDWYRQNADYLKWMQERKERGELDRKPRKRVNKKAHVSGVKSKEQAIEHVLKSVKKHLSSKINYDALRKLTAVDIPAEKTEPSSSYIPIPVKVEESSLAGCTLPVKRRHAEEVASVDVKHVKVSDELHFPLEHVDDEDEEVVEVDTGPSVADLLRSQGASNYELEEYVDADYY